MKEFPLFNIRIFLFLFLLTAFTPNVALASTPEGAVLGEILPIWSVVPFIGILLSIALFPLATPLFWHDHFGKVAAFWALVFAVPFLWVHGAVARHEILHIILIDYLPFIILLWGSSRFPAALSSKDLCRGRPL